MWAVPMDDRKRRVLRAIVTLYGADGEPVGSGLLAEQFGHAVSSATLRNEMAALTKLGLLEQPHTQRRARAQRQGLPLLHRQSSGYRCPPSR